MFFKSPTKDFFAQTVAVKKSFADKIPSEKVFTGTAEFEEAFRPGLAQKAESITNSF